MWGCAWVFAVCMRADARVLVRARAGVGARACMFASLHLSSPHHTRTRTHTRPHFVWNRLLIAKVMSEVEAVMVRVHPPKPRHFPAPTRPHTVSNRAWAATPLGLFASLTLKVGPPTQHTHTHTTTHGLHTGVWHPPRGPGFGLANFDVASVKSIMYALDRHYPETLVSGGCAFGICARCSAVLTFHQTSSPNTGRAVPG